MIFLIVTIGIIVVSFGVKVFHNWYIKKYIRRITRMALQLRQDVQEKYDTLNTVMEEIHRKIVEQEKVIITRVYITIYWEYCTISYYEYREEIMVSIM